MSQTMEFSEKEIAAVYKAANLMAIADGNVTDDEKLVIKEHLKKLCPQVLPMQAIEQDANEMEGVEVISILSRLSIEQKKYACGYLAAVMEADGKIHAKEEDLWTFMALLTAFPINNYREAIDFWSII